MAIEFISLARFNDSRGSLLAGEYPNQLPFDPVRFFLIKDVPTNASRGNHAHRTNQQLLVCVSGALKLKVNDGTSRNEIEFDSNSDAIYIPALHWGELSEFEPNTIVLVLASEEYNPLEYINDFDEFLRLTNH